MDWKWQVFLLKEEKTNKTTNLASFFLYTCHGEDMTIYLDLIFLLNLLFDFLLLLTVNNTLKSNASLKKIFLGSLFGSTTIFSLFVEFTTLTLFLFKLIVSLIMCVLSFGLKDKKYTMQNLSYFYMTSTVLGGFLYFLNLNFSESQNGLSFTYDTISIPYIFLVILSPILLYVYFKQQKDVKNYQSYYDIIIHFENGNSETFTGFLDTGNKLVDPITKKKIILVSQSKLKDREEKIIYVPYNSLNHHGLMKCIKIDFLEMNGKKRKNYLVGISEGDLLRDGIECVLNQSCLEEFL